jgi:hypothetical protein
VNTQILSNNLTGVASTVAYIRPLIGPALRPNGKMPLSAHAEAGRLLKEVSATTYCRRGVCNSLKVVRCTLDDWAGAEYPDQNDPTNEVFNKLYYHSLPATFSRHISQPEIYEHVTKLLEVKKILAAHYPDCMSLQTLLKKLDAAIKSLESWN